MDEYYDLPWEEDNNSNDLPAYRGRCGSQLLERWFGSEAWMGISESASDGDEDSLQLMEEVSDQLASLIFHLHNQSGDARMQYELAYFQALCDDFGVA